MTCVCGADINPHRFDEIERHAKCVASPTASTMPAPPDTDPVLDAEPTETHLDREHLEDL